MSFGIVEVLVILAVVMVFFGAGKLPTVMGDLAKGVRNFKHGMRDDGKVPADEAPRTTVSTTVATTAPTTSALLESPGAEVARGEPRRG